MIKERAIVLLSGGMDSTTLLYHVLQEGYVAEALIFDYGQKHRKEVKVALALTNEVSIPATVIRIPDLGKLGGSALTDKRIPIPAQFDRRQPDTVVPMRNSHFLCWAASVCEVKN